MKEQEKNQLMIQEIVKWKENRLLPKEQCDFLLALYTKGGELEIAKEKNLSLEIGQYFHFAFMLAVLVSVIFLDYYYNSSWYIPAGVLSIGFIINMLIYLKMSKFKNMSQPYRYLFLFTQLLYVLQLSIFIWKTAGLGNCIYLAIMLNGAGWMTFGYVRKMRVFKYAGLTLVIALMIYVVFIKYLE